MKKSLLLFFFLTVFPVFFSFIVAGERYQVKTNSSLNIRSGPGTSYRVIGSLSNNSYVNVNSFDGDWAEISMNGEVGYVSAKYIQKSAEKGIGESDTSSGYGYDKILLMIVVGLFIAYWCMNIFDIGNEIFVFILTIVFPILLIVYFKTADVPMWFLSPSKVGWMWTIINGFGLLFMTAFLWGTILSLFRETYQSFFCDNEFSTGVITLIILILYVVAIWITVTTAIMEFLIMGVLMILGSAGGGSYLGQFTDRNGNTWDIWEK